MSNKQKHRWVLMIAASLIAAGALLATGQIVLSAANRQAPGDSYELSTAAGDSDSSRPVMAGAAALGEGTWSPLGGPTVNGGMGRAIAVHPAISGTLYAAMQPIGSAWFWDLPAVIYESVDGGANWTPIYTTSHNVRALAVTDTIIYAGSHNRNQANPQPVLYRSGDGGLNWTAPISLANGAIRVFGVHPSLAQTAIAGGGDYPDLAVLYQTTDGGVTWTEVFSYSNPGYNPMVNAVLIHPTTPLTWMLSYDGEVAGGWGAYIYRSTDGGTNWTEVYTVTDDYFGSIVANPITPTIVYAGTGNNNLHRSDDGGMTWSAVITDGSAGQQLVVDPPDTLYARIENSSEVRKSTDGGDIWSTAGWANDTVWDLAIDRGPTPAILYGGAGGVDKSTDGGATWVSHNNGLETPTWNHDIEVDTQDQDRVFVAGGCSGGFVTIDGGETWSSPLGLPACMDEFGINPADPDVVYAGAGECSRGALLRSDDGGLTFQTVYTAPFIATDCSAGQSSVFALAVAPSMSTTVYAAGGNQFNWNSERAYILRSLDDGASWTEVFTLSSESGFHPMAIHPTNENIVYVGGYDYGASPYQGIVYRTTDGGANWTLVLSSTTEIASIVFDAELPNTLYASDYSYRIYKSTDAGDTWTIVRCAPWDACANAGLSGSYLAADPRRSGTIYVVGFGYVGESADGGRTWSALDDPINQGMVNAEFGYLATGSDALTQTLYGGFSGVWTYRRAALPLPIDLDIDKSVDTAPSAPGQAVLGQAITYTIAFSNAGEIMATGVVITDTIPDHLINLNVTNSGAVITATVTNPGYVWQVQDLAQGQGGTITVTGVVVSPLAGGTFTNTAVIGTSGFDPIIANNTAAVAVDIQSGQGSIQGYVFGDLNGNGSLDATESGLGGVLVTLYSAGADYQLGTGDDTEVLSTTTAASGIYSFTNVVARSYRVVETDPVGYASVTSNDRTVTVPNGDVVTVDFADLPEGVISGVVFEDDDGDGTQEANESGLSGVIITLHTPGVDDVLGTGDDITQTTTTDGSGVYSFTSVLSGTYMVVETDPVNYTSVTPNEINVNLPNGSSATANFADQAQGTVSGLVYNDLNGNGQAESHESGLSGVDLALVDLGADGLLGTGDDTVADTTITDGDGLYSFAGVISGSYAVTETVPSGYVAVTADSVNVSVPSGGAASANFGVIQVGRVGGMVYHDVNGDGQIGDSEPGLGGVVIKLFEPGPDGLLGNGDDIVIQATLTISDGLYTFTGVISGSYLVQETTPEGYVSYTGNRVGISVVSGGASTANFGDQAVGRIGGLVYHDLDGNGQVGAGESGLGGVSVSLIDPGVDGQLGTGDDQTVMTATTVADGYYGFDGVTPGNYLVRETDPSGFTSSTGNEIDILLADGGAVTVNCGDQAVGRVGGMVYEDWNGNGALDPGERGLRVLIRMLAPGADGQLGTGDDQLAGSTVSASDGSYSINGVTPGSYLVYPHALPGVNTTPSRVEIDLPSGGAASANFGAQPAGQVSGVVYNDRNGNGRADGGEPGISMVWVQLISAGADGMLGTSDDETWSTNTLGDGSYRFMGILSGQYTVRELDLAGYTSTTDDEVDVIVSVGGSAAASFGDQQIGKINGHVYHDLNRNGQVDWETDGFLAGVQISLIGSGTDGILGNSDDQTVMTTTTDMEGAYAFWAVPWGRYQVQETDPEGYVSFTPNTVDAVLDEGSIYAEPFGDVLPGEIRGEIIRALDGSLYRSAADVRLISPGTDGQFHTGDDVVQTAQAVGGQYVFRANPAGTYLVQLAPLSGYNVSPQYHSVYVPSDDSLSTEQANFVLSGRGYIYGYVFYDLYTNGRFDTRYERGYRNWSVELRREGDGTALFTALTDYYGRFRFYGLEPNTCYVVQRAEKTGYYGSTPNQQRVCLDSYARPQGILFGIFRTGAIHGKVYLFNGSPSGAGLGYQTISLKTMGADGRLCTGDDITVRTVRTSRWGYYAFYNLSPGYYCVQSHVSGISPLRTTRRGVYLTARSVRIDFPYAHYPLAFGYIPWFSDYVLLMNWGSDGNFWTFGDNIFRLAPTYYRSRYWRSFAFNAAPYGRASFFFRYRYNGRYYYYGTWILRYGVNPVGLALRDAAETSAGSSSGLASLNAQNPGSAEGAVFLDRNGNSLFDTGDTGLGNVEVALYSAGSDGLLGSGDDVLVFTATTDSEGAYNFEGLDPGTYLVTETDPLSHTNTSPNRALVLVSDFQGDRAQFGDLEFNSLSGQVYEDTNGNGVLDGYESGLSGLEVELYEAGADGLLATADDTLAFTTTTLATGGYVFSDLPPNTYLVDADVPAGFARTAPVTAVVSLSENNAGVADLGYRFAGALTGLVYEDTNSNGRLDDGENLLNSVSIAVKGPGADGKLGTGDDVTVDTTTTQGDGSFEFAGLASGSYLVEETDPEYFVSLSSNSVTVTFDISGTAPVSFRDHPGHSIVGTVYHDHNGNGSHDVYEDGLVDVELTLIAAGLDGQIGTLDDVEVATTTTWLDGNYAFGTDFITNTTNYSRGLTTGSYLVRETDPDGFTSVSSNTVQVDWVEGGVGTADFTDQPLRTVSGIVFSDLDRDGVQDRDELGIGGVVVSLLDSSETVVMSTTTTASGSYDFWAVAEGNYRVQQTELDGWTLITDNPIAITVSTSGAASVSFGNYPPLKGEEYIVYLPLVLRNH